MKDIKIGDIVRVLTNPKLYKIVSILKSGWINVRLADNSSNHESQILVNQISYVSRLSKEHKREQGNATDLESLRELARQRGYKAGWAERVHQARLAKRHGI